MKKLLAILLALAFVFPSAAAAAPPPPELPLIPEVPVRPGNLAGLPDLKNVASPSGLKLADRPKVPELAGMELALEKRDKGPELVRSLTAEQQARIGQLLAANPLPALPSVEEPTGPVLGREGAADQPQPSPNSISKHIKATEAMLPELKRWQAAMASGLAGILTPEQYALYQESLLPEPVQLGDVEAESQDDCYYEMVYADYGNEYAYYGYLYAYYSYANGEDWLSYDLYTLAYDDYYTSYYGYVYAYYAYVYYYDAYYAYYAYYFNLRAMILAYHLSSLAYDVYSVSGGSYAYYTYYYEYYKYIYHYYAYYYGYYCYVD